MRGYWSERREAFTPAFREAMDGWLQAGVGRLTQSDELYSAVDQRTSDQGP